MTVNLGVHPHARSGSSSKLTRLPYSPHLQTIELLNTLRPALRCVRRLEMTTMCNWPTMLLLVSGDRRSGCVQAL